MYADVTSLLKDKADFDAEREGDGPGNENGGVERGARRQSSLLRRFSSNKSRLQDSTTTNMSMSMSMEESNDGQDSDDGSDADETAALTRNSRRRSNTLTSQASGPKNSRELPRRRRRPSQAFEDYSAEALVYNSSIAIKKRTIDLYVSLCELRSFIQLNKTGFSKALKKYDKILDRSLKGAYLEDSVNKAYPFQRETMEKLNDNVSKMEQIYADVVEKGDLAQAKKDLRLHLREHVVWERNTVWREMIGIERKAQAANMGLRRTLLGRDDDPAKARRQGDDPEGGEEAVKLVAETRFGRIYCPQALLSSAFYTLVGIAAVFIVLLMVPILEKPEQQNCLAMLVVVSLLWATEVRDILTCCPPLN